MENHHRRRIARTLRHQDKENEACNNCPTPTELQALSVRGALGDLTPNVHPQRELNTDKNAVAAADFEKKVSSNRRYGRSNYSHIKANMDTGLAKKRIAPSSQPPPRREESKKGIAVAIKDDPKKEIEIKEPKNGKHVKKYNHLSPPKLPEYIEDIDADYNKNPLLMPMYIKNNYKHLKDLEEKYPIECDHLRKQTVITGEMRATLIDWLFAVYKEFSLLLETFHLTVGIIDRYLQAEPNLRLNRLQLVGLTAMFIASKYNKEIYSPELGDFLFVTDDVYSKYEALQCMIEILKKLGFNLSRPTPLTFLRRFGNAALGTSKDLHLAEYFVDLSLIQYSMAHYRPSKLAAAAICLSLYLLSNKKLSDVWTPTLSYYSGYTLEQIEPIIRKIAKIVTNVDNSSYKEFYNKCLDDNVSSLLQLKRKKIHKLAVI